MHTLGHCQALDALAGGALDGAILMIRTVLDLVPSVKD